MTNFSRKGVTTLFLFLLILIGANGSFAQRAHKKADLLFAKGYFHSALNHYLEVEKAHPKDAKVKLQIARCYVALNYAEESLQYALKSEELGFHDEKLLKYTLARAYHISHKFDKAKELYVASDPAKTNHKDISKKLKECDYGKKYFASPRKVKITNLGNRVNSDKNDLLPKPTADLHKLYFTSHRTGATGGAANPEDVYVSINQGGAWTEPKQLKGPINTVANDACVGISPDGQTMYLFKGDNGGDIYYSSLRGEVWTTPKSMPFNTALKETSITISSDGRELFFDRMSEGGTYNIYTCKKTAGGRWSRPQLVRGIRSNYDERAPFLHPDGKTLFFSSKGFNSMGGYDILMSKRDEAGAWGKPTNLGYPINTSGDELSFTLSADGLLGFYSSSKKGGYGEQDIYSIRMPKSKKPNLALLTGKVVEEATNKPVEATIYVIDNDANEEVARFKSNSKSGEYLVALPAGKNYGINIEKEGHLFHSENVYLEKDASYKSLKKNVKLMSAQPGAKIVLNNIFFETSKYTLTQSSNAELKNLEKLLKKNPRIRVEISGHTDNTGNAQANQLLSENRAKAVVDYLLAQGIPTQRLEYKGYGSTQPVADNNSAAGRQKNRRTEFKIIE